MTEAKYIWMDGEQVDWADAKVHVLTHTLHYGNAVFEGTRAYQTEDGLAIYRLEDHCRRLYNSAKIVAIEPNRDYEEVKQAHIDLLRSNDFKGNVYLRPLIYLRIWSDGDISQECTSQYYDSSMGVGCIPRARGSRKWYHYMYIIYH